MGYRAALLSFSKGEISPELEARFDLQAYQTGCRTARNVKIRRTGGLSKRMGMRYVAECLSTDTRLFPFQFSDEQGYALEFGQAYMRPLALGGAILQDGLKITAITKAAQAKITAAFHDYLVGDQVYLKTADVAAFGMREILDRWLTVVSVQDADNFTVDINSTGFTNFGSDVGTIRVGAPAPGPADPAVPAPLTPPPPPDTGSGSSGGYIENGLDPDGAPWWKFPEDTSGPY